MYFVALKNVDGVIVAYALNNMEFDNNAANKTGKKKQIEWKIDKSLFFTWTWYGSFLFNCRAYSKGEVNRRIIQIDTGENNYTFFYHELSHCFTALKLSEWFVDSHFECKCTRNYFRVYFFFYSGEEYHQITDDKTLGTMCQSLDCL